MVAQTKKWLPRAIRQPNCRSMPMLLVLCVIATHHICLIFVFFSLQVKQKERKGHVHKVCWNSPPTTPLTHLRIDRYSSSMLRLVSIWVLCKMATMMGEYTSQPHMLRLVSIWVLCKMATMMGEYTSQPHMLRLVSIWVLCKMATMMGEYTSQPHMLRLVSIWVLCKMATMMGEYTSQPHMLRLVSIWVLCKMATMMGEYTS